jgi:LysM repeat protein
MPQTAQQIANVANPTPVNINIPGEGQVFRVASDPSSSAYYYTGGKLYSLNLSSLGTQQYGQGAFSLGGAYNYKNGSFQAGIDALKTQGVDFNSIPVANYNLADLQKQYAGVGDVNTLKGLQGGTASPGTTQTINGPGSGGTPLPQDTPTPMAPGETPAVATANLGANGQANTSTGTALGTPLTPAQSQAPQYTLPSSLNSSNLNSNGTTNYQQPTDTSGTTTAAMAGVTGSYQQQLAAAEKEGPQDQSISNLINQTLGLNTQDAGKTAFTNQENAVDTNGAGSSVNARQAAVNSLQAQQTQLLNAYNASQLQDQQGQGVTTDIDQRQRDAVTKQYAIQSLATSSLLAAAQGDLANAQALAKQAVSAIYDPIEAQITANTANINLLKADPATTSEEKTQADAVTAILNAKQAAATQAKANATAVSNIGVTAASYLNNFVPTAQYPTAAQALAAITANQNSSNPDPMAAQLIATQTGLTAPIVKTGTWSQPYKIASGDTVQSNSVTGEIKVIDSPAATAPGSSAGGVADKTYTITRNDTLYSISQKKGITLTSLQDANPSVDANNLRPGQVINLPTASNSNVTTAALKQQIEASIATPEFKALSTSDKALYIQSQGGNPSDYTY